MCYEERDQPLEYTENEVVDRGWCLDLWQETLDEIIFNRFHDYYGEM